MRCHRLLAAVILGICCCLPIAVQADSVVEWAQLSSSTGDLEPPNTGNQQTASLILDIDGDLVNDFVIAERTQAPAVVWYRRTASGWSRYVLESGTLAIEAGGSFADIDGDGDQDISFAGDSSSNQIWWWENPAPDFEPATPWNRYLIKDGGSTKHHDHVFGDFDGDGQPELAFWNQGAGGKLYLAEIPADPKATQPWPFVEIFDGPSNSEGLAVADIDGDGVDDIAGAGYWFKHTGGTSYTANLIVSGRPFTRTAAGDLIPGGRPEVVIVPGDENGSLDYYEWNGAAWDEHELRSFVIHGHSLDVGDVNLDGHLDLFVAEMGNPGDGPNCDAWVYYGDSTGVFNEQYVSTGVANHESRLGDLDGDGDLDILTKPYNFGAPRVDVFLNETLVPPLTLDNWQYIEVDNDRVRWQGSLAYFGLGWGDINSDGFLDLVSGRYFYRNPGGDMTAAPWPVVEFSVGANIDASLVVDVDGDAFGDVISSTGPEIHWLEADDVEGTSWMTHLIDTDAPYEAAHVIPQGYAIADLVPGGRPEILFSNGDQVYYYEIPAENPEAGNWPRTTVLDESVSEDIGIADVDGDGLPDVAAAHWTGSGAKYVKWARNPGDGTGDWDEFIVGEVVPAGSSQFPDRVKLADLNGDLRPDIVCTEEISSQPASTYWFEAPADPTQTPWVRHLIVTQYTTNSMDVADMDNDGDIDVITQEHRGTEKLQIWENDGLGNFIEHVVDSGREGHLGARVADLDADGDYEIFSIAFDDYQFLHLWRNDNGPGGQINLPPSAQDGAFAVEPDDALSEHVIATDPNPLDTLEYEVVDHPTAGTLTSFDTATGAFTYQAPAAPTTDSFTFRAFDGQFWSNVATISISVQEINDPPIAVIGIDTTAPGEAPATVTFDGTASHDPDGMIESHSWDFDDGTGSDQPVVAHTFTENGLYTVTLTVVDNEGAPDVDTVPIYVGSIADGLAGYWPLDEGAGATAFDHSGNGHAGDIVGALWTSGIFGQALEFDGVDGRVEVGTFDMPGSAMTIAAWFKADDFGIHDARIISKSTGAAEQDHSWMLSTIESGGTKLRFRLKTDGQTTTLIGTQNVVSGEWVHAAAVYDGSHMILYTNGTESGSLAKSGAITAAPMVEIYIGDNPGSGQRTFDGTIDDVRLYDRGLTSMEIAALAIPPTIDCDYTVLPAMGTLPFQVTHHVTLTNLLSGGPVWTRRVAARINVNTGNGTNITGWRQGYANVNPGGSFTTSFSLTLPLSAVVAGTNSFEMVTIDVTPSPYNQPPYPADGTTCTVINSVEAVAP